MSRPVAIDVARANAAYVLDGTLRTSARRQDRDAFLLSEISLRFRTLGIAALLAEADREAFARALSLSARTECHLRSLDLSAAPEHAIASRWMPWTDALAAGDLGAAEAIARRAPGACLAGFEYEDDHLRTRFMQQLVLAPGDAGALQALLARWHVAAEGRPAPYHSLSQALVDRDALAFEEALERVLIHRRERLAAWRRSPSYREEFDATEGGLFVLGLAYLRLAELRGIALADDYEAMPALARIPLGTPLPPPGDWRRGAAAVHA